MHRPGGPVCVGVGRGSVFAVAQTPVERWELSPQVDHGDAHLAAVPLQTVLLGDAHQLPADAGPLRRGVDGQHADVRNGVLAAFDVHTADQPVSLVGDEEDTLEQLVADLIGGRASSGDKEGFDFEGAIDELSDTLDVVEIAPSNNGLVRNHVPIVAARCATSAHRQPRPQPVGYVLG